MSIVLALLILVLGQATWADESKGPHHQGTLSSLNLGIRYSSILVNRGLVLYRDFQIDPVIGVFLFDDKLEFLGDSIGYRDFLYGDQIRLRTRLVSITDKPFFPANNAIKETLINRQDSFEWSTQAEFFFPGYNANYFWEIDLIYAKDLVAHNGNYIEIQSKIKLFDFQLPVLNTKIEPNLFSSVGWGDSAHNQYFYGPSIKSSGFNNVSYGFWFAFPEEADRFYPIVQIKHFETIGDYRNSDFAKDKNEGWLFSFIATEGFL